MLRCSGIRLRVKLRVGVRVRGRWWHRLGLAAFHPCPGLGRPRRHPEGTGRKSPLDNTHGAAGGGARGQLLGLGLLGLLPEGLQDRDLVRVTVRARVRVRFRVRVRVRVS